MSWGWSVRSTSVPPTTRSNPLSAHGKIPAASSRVYGNRCFTDQVAGMMSGMKHGIGRGQMISELKAHFERVRKLLEQ